MWIRGSIFLVTEDDPRNHTKDRYEWILVPFHPLQALLVHSGLILELIPGRPRFNTSHGPEANTRSQKLL